MTHYGGADLGWSHDYSAVVTLRREPARLVVVRADRLPHGSWGAQIGNILRALDGCRGACVDATGMGTLALEEMRPRSPCPLVGVQFTASSKLEMAQGLVQVVRSGRLAVAPDCRGAGNLRAELQRVTVMPTRRGVRISGKAGGGDDVVMALALAIHAVRLPAAAWDAVA
jgi:hypothetical protein